jgi:hypothetical protein
MRGPSKSLVERLVSELSVLLSVKASTLVAVCRSTRRRQNDGSLHCLRRESSLDLSLGIAWHRLSLLQLTICL